MTSDHAADHGRRPGPGIDLDACLARIGSTGERRPTAEVLRSVHRAHALGIPFEGAPRAGGRLRCPAAPGHTTAGVTPRGARLSE
ncbi:hypothetical protein ACFVZR_31820 [Streptomyces sp. NPDC058316]|uniref:hypothetical protein n=1 Tax=unclassified Streptomyces TaxID=2593676 RepID=UPI00332DF4FE